jgi:uncharacterized RmlC-like cupin family protein
MLSISWKRISLPVTEYLSGLLFPLDTGSFLKHYQAREHFHIDRASPGYYADLLTVADVDAVLQSGHLSTASLNVVKEGASCPIEEWSRVATGARGAQRVANPESLLSLYASGATLILNQAHHGLTQINDACHILTRELGFKTQANIYITPRNSAAFSKHSDEHEVLVLQIAGSKSWIIYPADAPGAEIVLRPGDLLYVPRGMFHAARSGEEDSIHITLGLKPAYSFELIQNLTSLMSKMEGFQRPQPPLFAGAGAMQAFEADFLGRLQTLLAGMKPSALTDLLHDHLLADQMGGWPGRFSDLRLVHLMTPNTVVCRRPGILAAVKRDGKFLNVEFADRLVAIPAFMQDELPRVLGKSSFAIHEIGGMITSSGKVRFITEFVNAGLLRIISI